MLSDGPVPAPLSAEEVSTVGFLSCVEADNGLMERVGVAYLSGKLQKIVDCTGVPDSLVLRNLVGVPVCKILRRPSREISVSCEIGVQ